MAAIFSLLVVIALSFLVVRIGAIALAMTGLSDEIAHFQALSAFSGAGFTTSEAETVVKGRARRRIVSWLIRAGSVGIVSGISSLFLSFVDDQFATQTKLAVLGGGTMIIFLLARSKQLDRWTRPMLERALSGTRSTELRDYAALLHMREDWRIGEIRVEEESWLSDRTLAELDLRSEGVVVLGIEREGEAYEGAPSGDSYLEAGDTILVYGEAERLSELSERLRQDSGAHEDAKRDEEKRREKEEREIDNAGGKGQRDRDAD
ncbi:cation:proton antiporter regulatory subunit [Qipengyuania sp. MTN3-11]|uniref:cation:proton antiporter regulatory subunit n=1 Tax=Qipengyuania sp. MTN3-11 TaxID=3056557 RepID=UPI0036F3296C